MLPTDPATLLDPARPDFAASRFEILAALRAEAPATFVPAIGAWAVTRMAEVREVLGRPERFRSGGAFSASGHLVAEARALYDVDRPLFTAIHINTDRPLHTRLRTPMTAAFRPQRMRALEAGVRAEITRLADHLFDDTPVADLVARLARPLPMRTICRLLGLPLEHDERLEAWNEAFAMFAVPSLPPVVQIDVAARLAAFEDYVRDAVEGRMPLAPGLITELLDGRRAGAHDLNDDELVGSLAGIIFAGHETTVSTLANGFTRLLRDRTTWTALADGSADADAVTEEILRLDTSVIGLYRVATEEVDLGGVIIPGEALLWISYAAANRDPEAFGRPDELRPGRDHATRHVTFGHGIHYCIGEALARTQVRCAVAELPARYPTLRLVDDVSELPNHALRSTLAVPVSAR